MPCRFASAGLSGGGGSFRDHLALLLLQTRGNAAMTQGIADAYSVAELAGALARAQLFNEPEEVSLSAGAQLTLSADGATKIEDDLTLASKQEVRRCAERACQLEEKIRRRLDGALLYSADVLCSHSDFVSEDALS
jgi:hypothetical protein